MTETFRVLDRRTDREHVKEELPAVAPEPQPMFEFAPLFDRVIVLEDNEARKVGDLFLPDTAKDEMRSGTVISVGPGARNDSGALMPMSVQVGDHILFGKYSGSEVRLAGDLFLIMREPEVFLRVVKKSSA
jgi:chaperonin GroES